MSELSLYTSRCVLGDEPSSLRIAPARVVIRDAMIVEVVEAGPEPGDHDLAGQILAPAFVNAHTHLALHACRGLVSPEQLRGNLVEDLFYAVEEHLLPEDVEAFARVAGLECLLSGVGTVFDHYYHAPATARAVRDLGLAALVAPTLQDLAGPGSDGGDHALAQTADLDTDAWKAAGVFAALGPHATDTVSVDLWRRAVELAAERKIPLHAHLAQSGEEAQRSLASNGCSPIEWLDRQGFLQVEIDQLFVHALFASDADLDLLDPKRHVLGACLYSQMQFGFPAPVAEWTGAGLDWFVGTDTGASNDSMDVQKELRLIAGQTSSAVTWSDPRRQLRRGVDPEGIAALEAARRSADGESLRDPRHLLHRVWAAPGTWVRGLKTGVIAAGARAQLLVIDPEHPALWPARDPLRALALGGIVPAISGILAGGRWLGELGNPSACLDEPEVKEFMVEATERHGELMRRAGVD